MLSRTAHGALRRLPRARFGGWDKHLLAVDDPVSMHLYTEPRYLNVIGIHHSIAGTEIRRGLTSRNRQ